MAGLFHVDVPQIDRVAMLSFLEEVSQIVIIGVYGVMIGLVIIVSHIAMSAKDKRKEAEAKLAEADARIARLTSHGADLVQKVGWRKQRLMNRGEYRLFIDLTHLVTAAKMGHRVFTQVSCGEFLEVAYRADLKTTARDATHCLGRKRVDFLIIDRVGMPVVVVEYQGSGHYQGNAHDRDHAKRVACHAAGIRFIEVPADGLSAGQKRDMRDLLVPSSSLAAE